MSVISCKIEEPQNPPTVITRVASDVGLKNATLNGEVTDEGFSAASERGFVYSEKNTNPSVSDSKVQSGNGKGVYSFILEKLAVNTKYYFKAYATNTKGTSYGEVQKFTTADYKLPLVVTDVPKNITYNSVQLTGIITDDGGDGISERGFCISTSTSPTISNIKIENGNGSGIYTVVVTQLKEDTNYFIRAYAINSKGTSYGNEVSIKTLAYLTPTVITGSPSSIGVNIATLNGEVSNSGGYDITEKGFLYGTSSNVGFSDGKVVSSSKELGKYAIVLTNLKANTKYFFRAYSINNKGSSLGIEYSFVTEQAKTPTVSTNDFDQITETSVHTGLGIDYDGGSSISEYGVCISASNSNPTISDRKVIFGNAVTNFPFGEMKVVAGLTKSTTYYVKGYAINSIGVAYGKSNSFSTITPSTPTPTPITPTPTTPTPTPTTPTPTTPTPITSEPLFPRDNTTKVVEVKSNTGRIWMDRNLGANQVATNSLDEQAFGDLYQWGRAADGHQNRTSTVIYTVSNNDSPNNVNFIGTQPNWQSPQNNSLWQGVNGKNNPCPVGYRIPTITEWENEKKIWGNPFNSVLKLPNAGMRTNGGQLYLGTSSERDGAYWSSTISGDYINVMELQGTYRLIRLTPTYYRSTGASVRCIKD